MSVLDFRFWIRKVSVVCGPQSVAEDSSPPARRNGALHRYGKTSILKAAEDRLSRQGAVFLRYNAESYPSLELLIAALISGAAPKLKGSVERAGDSIRVFFAKLRPEVNFSVTHRGWNVRLGVAEPDEGAGHRRFSATDNPQRIADAFLSSKSKI